MDLRFDTLHFLVLLCCCQSISQSFFAWNWIKKRVWTYTYTTKFQAGLQGQLPQCRTRTYTQHVYFCGSFLSWYSLSWHVAKPSRVGNSSSIIMARSWWRHRGNLLLRQSPSTQDWTPRRIFVQHTHFLHWTLPLTFNPDQWRIHRGAMEAIASPKKVRKIFLNVSEKNPATGNCL